MDRTEPSEDKLQAQREIFITTLSHDLKNPVLAQIKSLELLLKGSFGEINEEQRNLLEILLESCKYVNGMLATLLSTYRNHNGIIRLNFEDFCFLDLVNECVSEMLYVAKDKGINIIIENSLNRNIINADRVQIKRVLMNLISNGIKYAFRNTDLKLKIKKQNNEIVFEFENKSPYIPIEKQQSIFAQYVSFSTKNGTHGIGLGLYASQKIIEGHKGQIYIKSFEDNTNIFGFSIPKAQEKELIKEICF